LISEHYLNIPKEHVEQAKKIIKAVATRNDAPGGMELDADKMDIDDSVFIPQSYCKHFVFEVASMPGPQYKALLGAYKDRGLIS